MRIALAIEYDGSGYYGWQHQPGVPTVQASVERALSQIADHPVRLHCAGRTDTGVHATKQVVHFDTTAKRCLRAWVQGTNSHLANDISVHWASIVVEDFHARFSATGRRYCYLIDNRSTRPALYHRHITWYYQPLDHKRMQAAANWLLGEHDFSAFRASQCQSSSPVRRVSAIQIQRREHLLTIDVTANAFLHHMVRNLAGVLMAVGAGKQAVAWVRQLLTARDRCLAGITAPANGLYLVNVLYPENYGLDNRAIIPLLGALTK